MISFPIDELMDQLYGSFDVIYAKWHETPPVSTHLWEITQSMSALDVLEKDIFDVGMYLTEADEIGTRSEVNMMAECIAHLRAAHKEMPVKRKAESMIDEISKVLMLHADPSREIKQSIYTPLSYRVAQYAQTQGMVSEGAVDALREIWIKLADVLLLRDGNITTGEDERIKAFHRALNQ